MFIFRLSLRIIKPVYKICNLSGHILYRTTKITKITNINKVCKILKGDYIFANQGIINDNEILVVKDENKQELRDLISRYRITSYFYKKVCVILKIYCYPTDYVLIYKLVQLDAQFIRFYSTIKSCKLHKCIRYNTECYRYLPAKMRHDKKLIMTLLDKNIDIGQFIGNKELKDIEIAIKTLKINQSNINYLILAHCITPEFINICESIYPYIFNRIKSEYLFRLTNLPNSTDNIARILFRAPDQLVFDFFEFDSCVTMGENIRNILKKYEYFIQYAPQFKQFILD